MEKMTDTEVAEYASRRLTQVEAEIRLLTTEAEALRQIKAGADALAKLGRESSPAGADTPATPVVDFHPVEDQPRGKEAVRLILKELGRPMNAAQVAQIAVERGWIEESTRVEDATRTNLLRAFQSYADIERAGRGMYVYDPGGMWSFHDTVERQGREGEPND